MYKKKRKKKEGFHRRSKGGDLEKSKVLGLGGVLQISFHSTTLQEVESSYFDFNSIIWADFRRNVV